MVLRIHRQVIHRLCSRMSVAVATMAGMHRIRLVPPPRRRWRVHEAAQDLERTVQETLDGLKDIGEYAVTRCVRGREKVPGGGQFQVPGFGQVEVPTLRFVVSLQGV